MSAPVPTLEHQTIAGVTVPREILDLRGTDRRVEAMLKAIEQSELPPHVSRAVSRLLLDFAMQYRMDHGGTSQLDMFPQQQDKRSAAKRRNEVRNTCYKVREVIDHWTRACADSWSLNRFIGQVPLVNRLRIALASAQVGLSMPHVLLVGPPGLGKTFLAEAIGTARGGRMSTRLAQPLNREDHLVGQLMRLGHGDVLFIDELHQLREDRQGLLLTVLTDRQLHLGTERGYDLGTITLAPFTLLAATTNEHAILEPLRDRFGMRLALDFYDDHELEQILRQCLTKCHATAADDAIAAIARRGRGVPRRAIQLLEATTRVAFSRHSRGVELEDVLTACDLEGVDEAGLLCSEQKYLAALQQAPAGVLPLASIAAKLGQPRRTLIDVIEPALIRMGLVERVDRGRRLTSAGQTYRVNV